MPTYSWLTQSSAIAQLQNRLSNSQFWTTAELWIYITEALRVWNSFTEQWNKEFVVPNANGAWINLGTQSGSPRLRTQTDINLYTQMEYMLLEPPSGGTWTGTSQFDILSLQSALQKRTQEVIQATACNLVQLNPINATPGTNRSVLPDTVLEPRRIRYMGVLANTTGTATQGSQSISVVSVQGIAIGQVVIGSGIVSGTFVIGISGNSVSISQPTSGTLNATPLQFAQPITLTREDTQGFQWFEPDYLQENGTPYSWSVASEPPIAFDVDIAPSTEGQYDVLALVSGPNFNPPNPSLLGVPDDWSWLPMYGALSDVLSKEAEATDRQRAAYCLARYTQGLEAFKNANWLLQASINNVPVDTPSLKEMDDYSPEWQQNQNVLPMLIQAGVDFLAASYGMGQSLSLSLLANAPLLDSTGTYVQVSRDDWESVINYAHHLCVFKQFGAEFESTSGLLQDFYRSAVSVNRRLLSYGIFVDVLKTQGQREEIQVPR